ncbi:RnfH family protein [Herbaspirillum sp.]|uniref:RnfH family protein n=1 Tax=Herbaspirillum TaxID=963 RepID=UPI00258DDF78|nr:RnfH family protein [Herbaspirillum sp.]MCP3655221.1 RnfH family protein [Herbaspirillum sp.]MCP3945600.1 RnfH family protein [Herbaspirillum sp.]MCP4031916.1 RnfH family protein [Herbaspirillum sp.]MCP4558653.1 RnfH family protein [Herbaspirillum sp.]
MAEEAFLQVQLCYAAPVLQILQDLQVAPGSTIQQAILDSGLLREQPAIDLSVCKVGIFGKIKTLDTVLRTRDRIEIYRPLIADPKQSRRRRAAHREQADRP